MLASRVSSIGTNPLNSISVIIPARNAERYLGEAIASIQGQTHTVDEIIVIDNGSKDGTASLARKLGATVESEPFPGASFARNKGISMARGEFLAFLDADDLWLPHKLEWQMEAFRTHRDLEAAFGLLEQFISPEIPPEDAARIHCPIEATPARLPSLMLIKKIAFERIGFFSPEWKRAEAVEWMVRAIGMGLRHVTVPHVVTRRRLHDSNMGITLRAFNKEYIRIIRSKMLRDRRDVGSSSTH